MAVFFFPVLKLNDREVHSMVPSERVSRNDSGNLPLEAEKEAQPVDPEKAGKYRPVLFSSPCLLSEFEDEES